MPTAFPVTVRLGRRADLMFEDADRRPALFLDRDGVLNEDRGYVGRVEDVVLLPGVAPALARANRLGVPVIVVSNQSGVGRGYFGWDAVAAVEERLAALLAHEGAEIDAILCAGAAPDAVAGRSFRKPAAGLFTLAARLARLDLGSSWMVGDKPGDLVAARAAGLAGGVLVGGTSDNGAEPPEGPFEWRVRRSLGEAADLVLPRLAASLQARPAGGRSPESA